MIKFIKYQAVGNDYIYIDCFEKDNYSYGELAKKMSDRHFGVGGDGVVYIQKSRKAHAKMRMFNSDGSEGAICGNALRCVADYIFNNKLALSNEITIETASGIKNLTKNDGFIVANMGAGSLEPSLVGLAVDYSLIEKVLVVGEQILKVTAVSVGNPHAVIFETIDNYLEIGKQLENHTLFKNKTNVEFVNVVNGEIYVKVWERGTGYTMSCGSGACAVAFAGVQLGKFAKHEWLKIHMDGGNLEVMVTNDEIYLKGEVKRVFEGMYYEN